MTEDNIKKQRLNWLGHVERMDEDNVKKHRLNWLGHVEGMVEDNNVQKIKRWKPLSKRPIGRPKIRWEDDVLEDIRSMNARNWKNLAQLQLEESV
jgi:hypothetical protein